MLSALSDCRNGPAGRRAGSRATREIDNVAAFARLYGVVRFFYPSDAAADLDWNRFAVHGVSRVRAARNAADLEATLEQLVAPLGPGIEIGARLSPAPAPARGARAARGVALPGPGFSTAGGTYRAKRTHRASPEPADGFATLMQTVPAEALRGKAIRLQGQVRATPAMPRAARPSGCAWTDRARSWASSTTWGTGWSASLQWRSVRPRGHGRRRRRDRRVRRDGGRRRDRRLRRGRAGGQGRDRRLDGRSRFRIRASRRQPATRRDPGYRTGTRKAAVSRPADGAPQGGQIPPIHALRRLEPPTRSSSRKAPGPGGARRPRPGAGLRARVPLALTDAQARPDPVRKDGLDALRTALSGCRRSERGARRRPEAGRRRRRLERLPPLLSLLDRGGRRLGEPPRAATRDGAGGRDPHGPARRAQGAGRRRPRRSRFRGGYPGQGGARGAPGGARRRSRAAWSSRRAACRPRYRSAPSS